MASRAKPVLALALMASAVWLRISIRFKREERLQFVAIGLITGRRSEWIKFGSFLKVFTRTKSLNKVLATSRIKTRLSRSEGKDPTQLPILSGERDFNPNQSFKSSSL